MNRIRVFATMLLTLGSGITAQAGPFGLLGNSCGASKCCGCASSCQPQCCKPTITRPCDVKVHTYQRACSTIKPPCCNTGCCPQQGCAPAASNCCAPAPQACAPAPAACAAPAPQACAPAPAACAAPAPAVCAAPAPAACAAPAPAACAAPAPAACGVPAAAGCAAPLAGCGPQGCNVGCNAGCNAGCNGGCGTCCNADPCEIAELIYQAQTACYAKDRRRAIHDLGDCFDCVCNPEIMSALIYSLNDSDERVRWKAADEIGDQLRKNCCCCTPEVIAALTCALADCDRGVRRQAEEALEVCGYEIVDGCCNTCGNSCTTGACGACGACGGAAAALPAPVSAEPARMQNSISPAPVPDPEAYFPSRMNQRQTNRTNSNRPLASLLGL